MAKITFRFKHYDLGALKKGAVIEISLNAVNNVRLMTDQHYARFLETQPHRYVGGLARTSPMRMTVPDDGHWHIIVDSEGHALLADSAVRLLGAQKPAVRAG